MQLTVPTLSIIIGEGGSGGAIALASSSKVLMLENAIYSVISPEGCATILWRDPTKTLEAAKAMKLSAKDLLKLEIIDEIIPDPLGGAHRDKALILDNVRNAIAPPEPPSPIIIAIVGTLSSIQHSIDLAIASA